MVAYNTSRLVISDFRPGIFSDYHASQAETPAETTTGAIIVPGAATVDDTFRCCADRTGALVPLPRLSIGKSSQRLPTGDNASSKYLTGMEASYLLDATVLTDMFVEGTHPATDPDRAAVFTMYGQWWESDLFRWTVITSIHRMFQGSSQKQDLMWAKGATSLLASEQTKAALGGGNFTPFRARELITSNFTTQCIAWVAYGSPGYGANPPEWTTGTITAGEQALTDFETENTTSYPASDSYRILGLFPDYDNLDTAQSKFLAIAGFTAVHYLATHQGRLIGASRDHASFGQTSSGLLVANVTEHIHYTPAFDFDASLGIGNLEFGTFGETKPYLSGVVASITADDLLLIKHYGGGVLVRGDLDDPSIIALPFIHSTGGAVSIPCYTPLGLYYGTRNGVYRWQGGETTEHMSPQLDGWFWNHDTEDREYLGSRGRFAWWEPWVCAPNNWLLDTRTEAWWRIDEVTSSQVAYNCYETAPASNRLYAFPWKLDATNQVMWRNADPETLATSYSWKSQPITGTLERAVSVRDVKILVTAGNAAGGTVTVTLSGFGQTGAAVTPVDVVFTLAAHTRPQQIEKIVAPNFIASYLQVKIVATGVAGGADDTAPKIHSITVGTGDRKRHVNAAAA